MRFFGSLCLVLLLTGILQAQEISRDAYLKFVPLSHPRLVRQTAASEALHLFGDRQDPAYRDVDPVDGIDDRRHDLLMKLAVRFAPFLVQNTTNIPTNFDAYAENADAFPLFVDTWDVSEEHPALVRMEGINFSVLGEARCDAAGKPGDSTLQVSMDGEAEDCKLIALLEEFSPWPAPKVLDQPFVRERRELFHVLFFNFPGEGPGSWERAYRPEYERTPASRRASFAHSYAHPFVAEVQDERGAFRGYELVLQYWFYYPSNDGGNNHEGDWEHMNVVIAPRSMVHEPLTAEAVDAILAGFLPATDEAQDPLVIRRVEYYFHHFVMSLDYCSPSVYQPRKEWKEEVKNRPAARLEEKEMWKAIRHMAYVDEEETRVNTHPFGYIGADNKGFDQALSPPGGKNRDSHGTFPFPGRYHNIGPAGATEQISVYVDPKHYWKRLKSGEATLGLEFKRGRVLRLAERARLRIVPDWERLEGLLRENPRVRRDWSWLVLPIRWGYPATESPFSGILPHADTGNLAPVGPAFSSGWNVTGSAPGFHTYEPHTFPSVFPLGLEDSFRNDLGYFNLTFPVLFNLPPLDFLTRLGTYPFKLTFSRRDPVYFPKDDVPYRFFALSSGISVQLIDKDYNALALNPTQFDEFIGRLLLHLLVSGSDSTTAVIGGGDFKDNALGPFFQIPFYIGQRFASENTVRNVRSEFGVRVDFNNIPSYIYSAELNYWEYSGSLRYSLSTSRLQPFLKVGYGWSWYRLEKVQSNGVSFSSAETGWFKPKRIWPNVLHAGVGIEYVPWRRTGKFPGGMELAFRFEYARYTEKLGLDLSGIPLEKLSLIFPTLADVPGSDRVYRDDFLLGLSLSF